eukprot:2884318-Pyramimonas_sp.AAC.1
MRKGTAKPNKEAPGPSYIPPMQKQAVRPRVAELKIPQRIALIGLARIQPGLLGLPYPWSRS